MAKSSIEWLARPGTSPEVWNPVTGCTKVSAGCKNCYAETIAGRFWARQYGPVKDHAPLGGYMERPRRFTDVQCHEDRLDQPLRWRKPRTVFVNSMSDLFHEDVSESFIEDVFDRMTRAHGHTFIVLTKRPRRMLEVLHGWESSPATNVWLGVSAEDQATADDRIPLLLQTPAAVRFVSAEPLLGGIDLGEHLWTTAYNMAGGFGKLPREESLDWIIAGGESGPGARPCAVAWIRSLVQQAQDASVSVFVKQLGAHPTFDVPHFAQWSGKNSDPAEWPADLRVRQWPEGV